MNVIFTYKPTKPFTEEVQIQVDEIDFSEVPEMRRVKEIINDELTLITIPYQANISEESFSNLNSILENYGVLEIVGKWDEEGNIIEFHLQKYCDALNDIETFEQAVFINGEDYTGRENEFVPIQKKDENDDLVFYDEEPVYDLPMYKKITRLKSEKRPTLSQAKQIHVNVFNANFKRKLDE